MSRSKYILVSLVVVVAGCSTTMMAIMLEFKQDAHLTASSINSVLLPEIRKSYITLTSEDSLIFESEIYSAESKGIFGFGPKWQEKTMFTLAVKPTHYIQKVNAVGKPVYLAQIGYVRLTWTALERQNPSFAWQSKQGDPFRPDLVRVAIDVVDKATQKSRAQSGDIPNEFID